MSPHNPHPPALHIQCEDLYDRAVPDALGSSILDAPGISVHLPAAESATGAGVIVAPGGGYRTLASDHEGLQVARWFNRIGVAAFVLRYRVGPRYHSSVSLEDGKRAVRYLREHALRFSIDPQRIGFLGFSAGGHLALAVSTRWHERSPHGSDPVAAQSARPDFVIGGYAVTNGAVRGKKANEYTPTDTAIRTDTPPTFLMHTHEDSVVPASQSTLHYNALLALGVPAELHIFNSGDHSLGLMSGDPDGAQWTALLHRWMRRGGFLTAKKRVAVAGELTIDGAAPGLAWVTLLPQDTAAPIARVCINRASKGKFLILCAEGPVSGPHVVEVHQVSEQYPPAATGAYTLSDAKIFRQKMRVENGVALNLEVTSEDFSDL